jgi:hypothetical protein
VIPNLPPPEFWYVLFPPTPDPIPSVTYEELDKKYYPTFAAFNVWIFVVLIVLAIVLAALVIPLVWLYYWSIESSIFLLRNPMAEGWVVIWAVFTAIALSPIATLTLLRWRLGPDWPGFIVYMVRRTKVNFMRLIRSFALVFTLICVVSLPFPVCGYTAFTNEAILTKPWWTLVWVDRHPYEDVRGIYEVDDIRTSNNGVKRERHYAILFADGKVWTTRDNLSFPPTPTEDAEVIGFVAQKCNRPVQKAGVIPDRLPGSQGSIAAEQ